jgi:hypothetical protein
MGNIPREASDARKRAMIALIKKNPTMSGDRLNEEFFKLFKARMRVNTIYALREELGLHRSARQPRKTHAGEPLMAAARAPQPTSNPFPIMVQSPDPSDGPALVESVMDRLREAGVLNLRCIKGPNWVVIEPAG